jgi:hypothetical protein
MNSPLHRGYLVGFKVGACCIVRRMLVAWLYWVGHAATLHQVDDFSGIPQGSLVAQGARGNGVLRDMTLVLHELLIQGMHGYVREAGCRGEVHLPPTHLSLLGSMRQFHRMASIRGVFAAVDGTLIQCSAGRAEQLHIRDGIAEQQTSWYWYERRTALLLLAAVDGFGHFIWFKSRVPGSVGDAAAWNGSTLERQLRRCHDGCPKSVSTTGPRFPPLLLWIQRSGSHRA